MKKTADNLRRVGLIGNPDKTSCASTVQRAARLIRAAGRTLFTEPATAQLAKLNATVCTDVQQLARAVDLLLVFGGDGTMLRVARDTAGITTPMLGINIGGLGFLTAVPSDELDRAFKLIWQGGFKFERRALIEATTRAQGKSIRKLALNDIVIGRGEVARLLDLEVDVNGDPLTRYRCDGLIVSSPTGSTAYSLAAGGAVVLPTADVFAVTPICPHTLSNRSLIVPLNATIRIKPVSERTATILSADGEVISTIAPGNIVTVRRSQHSVKLMHLADSSFFAALRRKLYWRGAYL
ncbi:MAG: NAD(+)/NADH kinase [Verrucomicrobiota bacterium]